MRNQRHGGTFIVSIDLESDVDGRVLMEHRQLASTCSQLIQLLSRLGIPATWAVADPAQFAATDEILSTDLPHELGIMGDASWIGPTAGRTRFARELFRRVQSARARDLSVSTLLLRNTQLQDNLDLLVKQQVTMVRPCLQSQTDSIRVGPVKTLRFGVWQLPASAVFPHASRWLPVISSFAIGQGLRRSLASGQTTHLGIDAPKLSRLGSRGIQSLERLLRDVVAVGRRQHIRGKTLTQLACDLSRQTETAKSQSILRKAG